MLTGADDAGKDAKKASDQANWKSLFDGKSLAGWKSTNFGGEGQVHIEKGAIVMERGDQMTGVTYTRGDFPKMNYEVTLEGKKSKKGDGPDQTITVAKDAKVSVEGETKALGDLKAGQTATLTLASDKKTALAITVGSGKKKKG